jgi:(4-(4-[2-(gamma-L-glutamylamino)ethyl]phenoxymethyl)furan-2-yl)methanamine synthase
MTPITRTPSILGWDIGGVNTKAALIADGAIRKVQTRPFELQRAPERLVDLLLDVAASLAPGAATHAVTMTAELSQMFRSKREGVAFVLDAVERAFPDAAIHVFTTDGNFISTTEARQRPIDVAAANWMATARLVSQHHPDALLIDVGTTTTDLIPIVAGRVVAAGRTDPQRLAAGELVYTGAVRTAIEAIVREVPLDGGSARVSAEAFALAGDVHVWLGSLGADDYDAATPDGRPSSRQFAGERLARVVCADRELLDEEALTRIARTVANEQIEQIAASIRRIVARHSSLTTAVMTGLGAFIGERAARAAGLAIASLSAHLGASGARSAPAAAVALLLDQHHRGSGEDGPAAFAPCASAPKEGPSLRAGVTVAGPTLEGRPSSDVTVIKIGGGLLANPRDWRDALATIAGTAATHRVAIVPGGGPFADSVRDIDVRFDLPDSTAHWMAIGAMDQHAEMIAATDPRFVRVIDETGVRDARGRGHIPVLAPLHWLRSEDPLPHSWDVTSDSIAAWLAGRMGASRLVLVKPSGAAGPAIVDPFFRQAIPPNCSWTTCEASELGSRLQDGEPARR